MTTHIPEVIVVGGETTAGSVKLEPEGPGSARVLLLQPLEKLQEGLLWLPPG